MGIGTPLAMCNIIWIRPDRFCAICQHTSSRPPFAVLSVAPWNKDDMGDGVPTDQLLHNHCDCTDSHCNSHIVTSCVFVLPFVPSPITSPSAADSFYFLKSLGTGQPCVICQDKTHLVEFPLRVGIGVRCVRVEGSRSPAWPLGPWGANASKRTPLVEGTVSLFLCHPPITRPAACARWRRTSPSSGSSARRGGLEEARLVNLARQSSVFRFLS